MQLNVLSEFCSSFKNLQLFDVMHVMFHVHWNMGEHLLPIPFCFAILLKMNISFLFLYKEDLWVGCFVYLLACFTVKKSRSCLFWKTSQLSENTVKFTSQIIGYSLWSILWFGFASLLKKSRRKFIFNKAFLSSIISCRNSQFTSLYHPNDSSTRKVSSSFFVFVKSHFISHWYNGALKPGSFLAAWDVTMPLDKSGKYCKDDLFNHF